VELEGGEALVHAIFDMPLVLVERVPCDRRGVGRDSRVVAAQHLVDRHARLLALDVPEQAVEDAEMPDRDLLDPVDLPDQPPQPLGEKRVLADELLEPPLDQALHRGAVRHAHGAEEPFVGVDADDRLQRFLVGWRAVA
jgi:hypothetical protein